MRGVMDGYVIHPHATTETKNLFEQATKLATSVPTPSTRSVCKRTWDKFVTYAQDKGFNPMVASHNDIVPWQIKRSEETASPLKVLTDLLALICWQC